MLIAVLNQSTRISNANAQIMTQAVAAQIRQDVAPVWDRAPAAVVYYSGPATVPAAAHGITIVDSLTGEPKGTLGYHTEQAGKLWGLVAANPSLDSGAAVLTGDWSVSSILSHEVVEMFVDPNCNLWASNDAGRAYSFEVCDPVEAPTYDVNGVSVSNFVTPSWFDPLAPAGTKLDNLGLLRQPFTLLKGGYLVYAAQGKEQQEQGDDYPDWRLPGKRGPLARSRRRIAQAATLDTGR